ncbi:hypothetical protein SAMN04487818_1218 [Actinokineospora terrae]|uniref:Uncharacterized protein n=1 Tax=Actinokineospora terrae TaxID=155974 RepID=A0A1H9XRA1_9PSEU|nr:hypothetical protein SAMN04487818_1218 [Actinokineospora terrae]
MPASPWGSGGHQSLPTTAMPEFLTGIAVIGSSEATSPQWTPSHATPHRPQLYPALPDVGQPPGPHERWPHRAPLRRWPTTRPSQTLAPTRPSTTLANHPPLSDVGPNAPLYDVGPKPLLGVAGAKPARWGGLVLCGGTAPVASLTQQGLLLGPCFVVLPGCRRGPAQNEFAASSTARNSRPGQCRRRASTVDGAAETESRLPPAQDQTPTEAPDIQPSGAHTAPLRVNLAPVDHSPPCGQPSPNEQAPEPPD